MGAFGAFIFGLWMSMVAIYFIMSMMFAPALEALGINALASHMFFCYWATLSSITPPVCMTVYTTSAIANSDPMKTGITAVKFAFVIYVIPFAFVLNPALLMDGPWASIVLSVSAALAGHAFDCNWCSRLFS